MGHSDFLVFSFANIIQVYDWYTKQVIFKNQYTHGYIIDSLHKIGDAYDRFFITDVFNGIRYMLVLESNGNLFFQ